MFVPHSHYLPALVFAFVAAALFSGRAALGQDISVTYALDEEQPAGTPVGNVADDSRIRGLIGSEEEFRAVTYSFLAEGGNFASNFRLQNTSGMLTTAKELDREALCSFLPVCRLSLRLAAQSSLTLFFRIIDVSVMVTDINDNAPFFQPPTVNLSILESADIGDLFQLPTAVDADVGVNHSVRNYSLMTSGVPFGLTTEASGSGLWLQLTGLLDREARDFYRLLVVAVDGGQPVHSGTLTIGIQVGDVNDHAPLWERERYSANVSEIEAVGSVVLTLRAHDSDKGHNAVVLYRFSPLQADIALGLFALNETSGEITVAKPLDSYAGQTYRLEVEARDSGTPFKTSRTQVVLKVLDTHNSRPEMILSVFGASHTAVLSERSELGRVVAHIAVRDPDSGLNGIVLCRTNATHFELQPMDVRQYKVIVRSPLDRETQASHRVSVTCQDAGTPPLQVTRAFTVQVHDENDQVPVFTSETYQAVVRESMPGSGDRDVYVTSVSATDDDVGENARLSFRILQDNRQEFRALDNGTILAVRGLDRESGPDLRQLLVVAHDHGAVQNSATATLLLTVLDTNDHAPLFPDPHPLFHVAEDVAVTSFVGNVTASDADEGENARVTYSLLTSKVEEGGGGGEGGMTSWMPFQVSDDGVVSTVGPLDRESVQQYHVVIVARDHGSPAPLSSTVTATVIVDDVNDNCPSFLFPSPLNNTLTVPHSLAPHTVVTSLRAYDADAGINGQLVYSRERVNGTSTFFDVVPATGEVLLVRSLTAQEVGEHVLTVSVHDQGVPLQLANQTLLFVHVFHDNQSTAAGATNGGGGGEDGAGDGGQADAEAFQNTVVVVVIVVVTVVLSAAVGMAIMVMKRKDRHKHLYRAKEAEYKVDDHLRQLAGKQAWSHEMQLRPPTAASDPYDVTFSTTTTTTTPTPTIASDQQRRRKEVSFSLEKDNNYSTYGAPSASATGNGTASATSSTFALAGGGTGGDNLEAIPEVTHSQKRLLPGRGAPGPEDDVSDDVSQCDVSTSDSGRGGSDVEMHNQQAASREAGDAANSHHNHHHHHPYHRAPLPPHHHRPDARRHPYPHPHPFHQQSQPPPPPPPPPPSRSVVTFDPYPLTFPATSDDSSSPPPSRPQLTTFQPQSNNSRVVAQEEDFGSLSQASSSKAASSGRPPMTSFLSSFSTQPRVAASSSARASPSSSSASSLPPCRTLSRVGPASSRPPPPTPQRGGVEVAEDRGDGGRWRSGPSSTAVSSPRVPPPPSSSSSVGPPPPPSSSVTSSLSSPSAQQSAGRVGGGDPLRSVSPSCMGEGYIDLHRQRGGGSTGHQDPHSPRGGQHPQHQQHQQPPRPLSSASSSLGGSYVQLKQSPRHGQRQGQGRAYSDRGSDSANYVPSSQLSSGTGDEDDTTISGSYTLDPESPGRDMDQLFFHPPGDVVV